MTTSSKHEASIPNPALKPFSALVGEWTTVGTHGLVPGATYHGRTSFEDDAASGNDRLLLRLWLCMPNNRALPEGHEILWQQIEAGKIRGGIQQITI